VELWLIRTLGNKIKGPFTSDEIRGFISRSELRAQDEVCKGNGYWFHLNEAIEVKNHLGMDPIYEQLLLQEDEVTEISQETATLKLNSDEYDDYSSSSSDPTNALPEIRKNAQPNFDYNIHQKYKDHKDISNFRTYSLADELKDKKQKFIKNAIILALVLLLIGVTLFFLSQ